jgi:hypothetical protein
MRSALSFLIAYVGLFEVAQAQDIAIANATVYTSPGAAAQPHTTVLIQGGMIVAVGNGVSVPSSVQTLPCRGCVVFAGFWNTHVHFTGPQWNEASKIPANTLTQQMQAMLTHSGDWIRDGGGATIGSVSRSHRQRSDTGGSCDGVPNLGGNAIGRPHLGATQCRDSGAHRVSVCA